MTRKRKPPAKQRKRAPAPTLDAATLRHVERWLVRRERAAHRSQQNTDEFACPETHALIVGQRSALDAAIVYVRNRATRIEKQLAREASIPLSSQHYTSPLL